MGSIDGGGVTTILMNAIRHKGRAEIFSSVWVAPLGGLLVLTVIFSLRLLSDPDLGFHLNAGRWIINHLSIPQTDIATYTVPNHGYIDLHWLFQIFIYTVYSLVGYPGLSILVCIIVCLLFFLLARRMATEGIPYSLVIPLLLLALLIIEPRFILRPELFTYLFITLSLIILDNYYRHGKHRALYFLPLIMLFWCNIEGLFMLGYSLIGAYFISIWIRDRKPDLRLLGLGVAAVLVCLINPYGVRGLLFPFELLTRFQAGNIFHEHIKEFQTIFQLEEWTVKEYAALFYLIFSSGCILITLKQRKPHELILSLVFGVLFLLAIRNIPLFIIVTLPITGVSADEIIGKLSRNVTLRTRNRTNWIFAMSLFLIMMILIPRLITNTYYANNLSYNKTGTGLDPLQLPAGASSFIRENQLEGRIINSLSYGGWLSWRLSQPIFIDARLEVIGETLYTEVAESWKGGLSKLIMKYNPDLLVYDYVRYFSWTPQLLAIPGWHPIYMDGQSAVFAREGYAGNILFQYSNQQGNELISEPSYSPAETLMILTLPYPSAFTIWLQGFYKKYPTSPSRSQNMASFLLQMKNYQEAERYFLTTLKESYGSSVSCYYALADIYMEKGDFNLAGICYKRILEVDPTNTTVQQALAIASAKPVKNLKGLANCLADAEATKHYNNGNIKYKKGDIKGALEEYSIAIRLNPTHSKAYLNRAYIEAVELQKFEIAVSDFDTAIALDPGYADAYLGRGSSRYSLHDKEGALEDWERAESLGNKKARELIQKHQR